MKEELFVSFIFGLNFANITLNNELVLESAKLAQKNEKNWEKSNSIKRCLYESVTLET